MTLVVTADDFGLCPEIDDAICVLHDRGVVTRTSLLVNTPLFESSVEALRRRPGLEVAIHLNLTDGRPVLPATEVPSLVDAEGRFAGGRHYGVIAGIMAGRVDRGDIHREWRAQIAKGKGAGLTFSELNAHGHLHLLPALQGMVLDLQREFAIPRVRLVRSHEWPRGVLLHLCSLVMRRRQRRRGAPVTWPDATVGLRTPGDVDPRIRLDAFSRRASGTTELIAHPAARRNPYHDRWGYRGEEVLNWLLALSDTR
jgi:predicted glycoside hydrolase/deacetylase ChbG (UPF0249 family)